MSNKNRTVVFDLELGFRQGLEFERAHNWLQWEHQMQLAHGNTPGPVIAIAVNSAFAAEIYLKCLQLVDFGNAETGHLLDILFERLKPGTQDLVRQHYEEDISRKKDDIDRMTKFLGTSFEFDSVLQNISNAFIEWRYFFENVKKMTWNGSLFKFACRRAIVDLKPDLARCLSVLQGPQQTGKRTQRQKSISDYRNKNGEPVSRISVVRIYGNGTRTVVDQNGQEIPELQGNAPIEEVVRLADSNTLWIGDHGLFDPMILKSDREVNPLQTYECDLIPRQRADPLSGIQPESAE